MDWGSNLGLTVIVFLPWLTCWLPFVGNKEGQKKFGDLSCPFFNTQWLAGLHAEAWGVHREQVRRVEVWNKWSFSMVPHGLFVCLVFWFMWKEFIPWLTESMHSMFSIPRWVDVNVYSVHLGESYIENRKRKEGKPTGTRCQGYVSPLRKQFLCRARAPWGL